MAERPEPSYVGDQPFVFVSYGHADSELVFPEMRWLQEAGFNLWHDDGIHVGSVWRKAIADALTAAAGMLFVATKSSVESDHCLKELSFVLDEGKPVFVVQLDDTKLPGLLRLSLADRQMLNRAEFDEKAYRAKLVQALSTVAKPAPRAPAEKASSPAAPPAAAIRYTNNLPKRLGALIGRESEMGELVGLLERADLVTITGTGGVGKTRIAIEVGLSQLDAYEDGVWLVELAPVSEPEQVPVAIARAMNIELPGGQDPQEALVDRLRARECLVLLDNCEHVIDAVAGLAGAEHAQHADVAGGFVAAGVGGHPVQRPVAAGAGQFAQASMLANRVEAGLLAQPLDRNPNCRQPPSRRRPRAWLGQPACDCVEVGKRLVGVAQLSRHVVAASAAGVRDRQLMVSADAVDPGLHLGRVDQPAGGDVRVGLGDHLGFPGEPALLVRLGFRAESTGAVVLAAVS